MKPLVLYHASCADGFTAAWAAWRAFDGEVECVPVQHGSPPPDVTGRDVLILDFSYARETLLAMKQRAASLRVLDHHASAERALAGLDFCVFDMERSGAGLAWDVLCDGRWGGPGRPRLVDIVEDRDLWRFRFPETKAISAALWTYRFDFDVWTMLGMRIEDEAGRSVIVAEGEAILRYQANYHRAMLERVRTIAHPNGLAVAVINAPGFGASELLHAVIETKDRAWNAPFVVGWSVLADGRISVSLRGDGTYDLGRLAALYEGGGHRNAAGFTVGPAARMDEVVSWLAGYAPTLNERPATPAEEPSVALVDWLAARKDLDLADLRLAAQALPRDQQVALQQWTGYSILATPN